LTQAKRIVATTEVYHEIERKEDRLLDWCKARKKMFIEIDDAIQPVVTQIPRSDALPKSVLAKACNYTLTLWGRLTRFLEYPELELSNNLAENAMRPLALGRRYEQSGIRQSLTAAERDRR